MSLNGLAYYSSIESNYANQKHIFSRFLNTKVYM